MTTVKCANLLVAAVLLAAPAWCQAPKTFEVATVRPSAPLDIPKLQAQMRAGQMPNFGAHIDGLRAEYTYMSLHDLLIYAYNVKPYEVVAPDWMNSEHFDIAARMPEGSTKDDAPEMLKALLIDRFKLARACGPDGCSEAGRDEYTDRRVRMERAVLRPAKRPIQRVEAGPRSLARLRNWG